MYCQKCGVGIGDADQYCQSCGASTPLAVDPASPDNYADFLIRLGAWFLDLFGFGLMGALVGVASLMIPLVGPLVALVFAPLSGWFYYAIFECSEWQATPGKKILGLKVVSETGQRIGFGRATARWFAKILSSLFLCIGFIMIAFTRRRQGLHDLIAGTLVIKTQ